MHAHYLEKENKLKELLRSPNPDYELLKSYQEDIKLGDRQIMHICEKII